MTEIEFFIGDEPPEALGPGEDIGGPTGPRRTILHEPGTLATVGLYAAAAALAVLASFQKVMQVRQAQLGNGVVAYSTDGWGRLDVATAGGVHDTRYGIALCACAAGFALLGLALGAARVRPAARRSAHLITAAGLAVATALGGVLAAMALTVDANFDNRRAYARGDATARLHLSLRYGWCLWLGLAAAAVGLLAVAATALLDRGRSGGPQPPGKLG